MMTIVLQEKEPRDSARSRIGSGFQSYHGWLLPFFILGLCIFLGCQRGPVRVSMPEFDPDSVAAQALANLDTDGDALLSEQELQAAPGLLASIPEFDQNGDRNLTFAEIADRLAQWRRDKAGLLPFRCEVTWKGKPLKDANIRLVAESFFDGAIPDASGVSDFAGSAELSCNPEDLPEALKSVRAIRPGIYRIEITHPSVDLPAKYNSKTTLGKSVSLRNSKTLVLNL